MIFYSIGDGRTQGLVHVSQALYSAAPQYHNLSSNPSTTKKKKKKGD
jgi:hypothetical protein